MDWMDRIERQLDRQLDDWLGGEDFDREEIRYDIDQDQEDWIEDLYEEYATA